MQEANTPEMKINVAHRIEGIRQENHPKDDFLISEVEGQRNEEPNTEESDPKVAEENPNPTRMPISGNTQNPSSGIASAIVQGKRKRKPKEMIDQVSPFVMSKRKRKQPSASNPSPQEQPDSGGKSVRRGRRKAVVDGESSPDQLKSATLVRAEEIQSNLGDEYPSFVKLLVRSNVASCFWMGLPQPFCKSSLPRQDTKVILENESGEEVEVKYIAEKTGLSAGWRKFATSLKLVEGDALIFQLVGVNRFKVHVVRTNDLNEVDGALSLLDLEAQAKQDEAAINDKAEEGKTLGSKKHPKTISLSLSKLNKRKQGLSRSALRNRLLEEHSGNDSDEVASEVLEGSKFSGDATWCKDVKSFEDFHLLVNGTCIDSEVPEHTRRKYYELCRSKNVLLHNGLLPGLHCKLVAGMIFEAVNVVDSIRACKLTTPKEELEVLDKSLRSFEILGMDVGFLRARVHRLLSLAHDSEGGLETRRYLEAKAEHSRTRDEMRNLEAKLVELKEACEKYDAEVKNLKPKAERYELMFREEVEAPW